MRLCPKCGTMTRHSTYFGRYSCPVCGWSDNREHLVRQKVYLDRQCERLLRKQEKKQSAEDS